MGKTLLITALCLLQALGLAAQHFRFAQLTDLHLRDNSTQPTEDLMACIKAINAMDSVDFVLVTGDISDSGDRSSLVRARSVLDKLRVPYHIIMGNHETKWSESGCTAWQEVFGGERFVFEHKGVHFLGFNTGPLMRMAYGHVTTQDLLWMGGQMKEWRKDEPIIVVTHYPLLDGDVDNWYRATDLLRQYNVRLLIGGHYHSTGVHSYDGLPGILMRSTLRDEQGLPGFGIYEVTPESIHAWQQDVGGECRHIASYAMKGAIKDKDGNILDANGHCEHYPSMQDNIDFAQVQRQWITQGEASVYSSPAVLDNRLFVGDDAGTLTAYGLNDGHILWSQLTGARIVGTPAAADGTIVVGSADGYIYAFRAKTGKLRWRVKAESPVLGAVTINDGIVYVGASDHRMRAIDLHTGKLLWTYDQVEGYIETKPLITEQQVIFGAWDRTLYCLNRTDGSLIWKWQVPRPSHLYSPAAVWPVQANGRIFIADPDRALTAINQSTGETIWRTHQSMVRESVGLSADGERLYAKTMRDSVVCYSTTSAVPRQLWRANVEFGYEHAPCMLPEMNGIVYGSTRGGIIFALDGKTGRLLWRHRVGSALVNTVVPLTDGRVLFTTTDGIVGMLNNIGGG